MRGGRGHLNFHKAKRLLLPGPAPGLGPRPVQRAEAAGVGAAVDRGPARVARRPPRHDGRLLYPARPAGRGGGGHVVFADGQHFLLLHGRHLQAKAVGEGDPGARLLHTQVAGEQATSETLTRI